MDLRRPSMGNGLLHWETNTLWLLSKAKTQTVLGSGRDCDISIPETFVSKRHCALEARRGAIRITDQRSKNGVFFEGERRRRAFTVEAGRSFVLAASTLSFLVLDEVMIAHHAELTEIVGVDLESEVRLVAPTVAGVISAATDGIPLLIISQPHCEQERLARLIHEMSTVRAADLVGVREIPATAADRTKLIKSARGSTLVLNLADRDEPLDPTFVAMLFRRSTQVRTIILAQREQVASKALGEYAQLTRRTCLLPLGYRPREILRLLNREFERAGSALRVTAFTPENQNALRAYEWPQNFASLREAAKWLTALAAMGSLKPAAAALKIPPSTFHRRITETLRLREPWFVTPR